MNMIGGTLYLSLLSLSLSLAVATPKRARAALIYMMSSLPLFLNYTSARHLKVLVQHPCMTAVRTQTGQGNCDAGGHQALVDRRRVVTLIRHERLG